MVEGYNIWKWYAPPGTVFVLTPLSFSKHNENQENIRGVFRTYDWKIWTIIAHSNDGMKA